MGKLQLTASPTFQAKVGIPVAGGETVEVAFTFKHRTKDDLLAWIDEQQDNVDAVMDCVTAWDLDDKLTRENVALLDQNYLGACGAIAKTYLEELRGARTKN